MTRKRVLPLWQPVWSAPIEAWTAKQAKQHKWRFDPADDFDDIMQECRLLFFKLGKKYPLCNERHFFALYRTSLFRMFHDKARLRQRSVSMADVTLDDLSESVESPTPNTGYINVILQEMPDELKSVLEALTTGRIRLKLDKPAGFRRRETHNMRIKRLLRTALSDPAGDLKRYLVNP